MARFIKVIDAVNLPMLGNDDLQMRSKGRLLKWAPYVYEDMNMASIKKAKREVFFISKRTNTVDLPIGAILSSVNLIDHNGVIHPVYRNDRLHNDLIDIPADKDCACEHKCGYRLCSTIKGYEAITSTKSNFLPNGTPISFVCVDRKAVDSNGFFYEEVQEPLRVYLSGVWTDTILHTEQKKLCKLEVDHNGCPCDTEENVNHVCQACRIKTGDGMHQEIPVGGDAESFCHDPNVKQWIYYCNTKMDWLGVQCGRFPACYNEANNIYNLNEAGNRLIFPHNFGWDRVMVRFYIDPKLFDMEIPFTSVETFVMGLKAWDTKFNDKKQALAGNYEAKYSRMKFGLLKELNKYRIAEIGKIIAPPIHIPSYSTNHGFGYYGEFFP